MELLPKSPNPAETQILTLFDMDVVSLAFLKYRVRWYKDPPLYLVFGRLGLSEI